MVCFAAGHRKIYTNDLRKFDVQKLFRRAVSPTSIGTSCGIQYFTHGKNGFINNSNIFVEYHGFKIWSSKCLSKYWKFANDIALLHDNRWAKRILHWNPGGGRPGQSFFQWQTPIQFFVAGIGWATGLSGHFN